MAETEPFEVVISGIGGKFPESNSMEELKNNLFGKVDMITVNETDYINGYDGILRGTGKIFNRNKFDATFFGVHRKLSEHSDPRFRTQLERIFEAIIDSGNNPQSIVGTNIGVYCAVSISESQNGMFQKTNDGFAIVGHCKTMIANRISYFYNLKGPSFTLGDTWVGGFEVLRLAAKSIADGSIPAAIIGVSNIHCIPKFTKQYEGLDLICSDGKCRSFDNEATGYPRSEGVVAFFLQRKIDAKRNYGTIVHVKTEQLGNRECGFIRFEDKLVTQMLREFYKECKVDPSSIAYLEADGSAVKRVETIELNSLSNVLCEGRQSPLLIGSVKSNLGHTEASSALVSVVKTVIAMENGIIPPNLHYNVPNAQVAALGSGKLKVVSEAENLPGDLVAVNVLSYTGGMGHVVLRRNSKVKKEILKDDALPEDGLPRLILASSRHAEGIKKLSDSVKNMALDVEFVSLMNNIHKDNITGHMYRMYHILPSLTEDNGEIQEFNETKPEVWFIFSGMGSQWSGMGAGLLKIPVFAAAIDKCDKVLTPYGIDIKHILTSMDQSVFENIVNCFVGIAAVQIGLVDVLKTLNITADGFVGHSVGELGCAYADGCFTAEEMILSSYFRGRASLEAGCIKGMMAAVGLGYNDIKHRLPESIQVACHNSSTSCTLSGPAEDMMVFVDQLKSEKTFATAVNVANIAYHSRYVAPAGPILLKYLNQLIKDPKPRSSKWICSSIPESAWNTPLAKSCSAEYFTNNLLSPVLFEETCRHIPANAITIEIAPHGLLQAILRRSLPTTNLPLTNRSATCSVRYLLKAVGSMYLNSLLPDVNALYPAVEYPVSRGTPEIAGLVSWDHKDNWPIKSSEDLEMLSGYEEIDIINKDNNSSDLGHRINNQVVIPVSVLLIYVWKRFCILLNMKTDLPSVVFQDVNIAKHVSVPYMDNVKMYMLVQCASGSFEIKTAEGELVMCGRISQLDTKPEYTLTKHNRELVHVSHSDFYSLFESRGFELNTYYKAVKQLYLDERECSGEIIWDNNWVPFLDSLFKVNMFLTMNQTEGVHEPSFIQRLSIDTSMFSSLSSGSTVPFSQSSRCNIIQCDGVELFGVKLTQRTSPAPSILKVEKLMFVPHVTSGYEMKQLLSIVVQVVSDTNMMSWQSKVTGIVICEVSDDPSESLAQQFHSVVQSQFNIEAEVKSVLVEELKSLYLQAPTTFHLIVSRSTLLSDCIQQFDDNDNVYFLTYYPGKLTLNDNTIVPVLQYKMPLTNFALLKKRVNVDKWNIVDNIEGSDWLLHLRSRVLQIQNDEPIIMCWNYKAEVPVSQICKVLSMEEYVNRLRCFFILDKNAPAFSKTKTFYVRQLQQGLAVNVMSGGVWGSIRRLEMDVKPEIYKHQVGLDVPAISVEGVDVKYFGLNSFNLSDNVEEVKDEKFDLQHLDYSGLSENGTKVMGLAQFQKFKNLTKPDDILSWKVPEGWSLEEAATVPLAFTTAYYSLALLTKLRAGETVLITAGYSLIGEAAIAVAMYLGGDVYTTVSNDKQTAALVKRFPTLSTNKILHEINIDVSLLLTLKGKKVKVIINCLEECNLNELLGCLDNNSQFVQLSQTSMKRKEKIGMQVFLRNTAIYGVANGRIFNATQDWKNKMKTMVEEGIKKGVVKPLHRRVFAKDKSNMALTYLKNYGLEEKVILAMKQVKTSQPDTRMQFKCDQNKSYLILGTKYSLWLDFAEWLVVRGARKIVVAVEKLPKLPIDEFESKKFSALVSLYNSKIKITSATCADTESDALKLLKETIELGPLAAIFSIMSNDSNKIKNLDLASRKLAPESPFFVCLFGGGSEVCDIRRQSGLPGLAIQWDIPLQKPAEVLNYLQPLLDSQDANSGSHLILVNAPVSCKEQKDLDSCYKVLQEYLPSKLELYDMGASLSKTAVFEEVSTLCPRKKFVKSSLCLFLFPGINTSRLQSLTNKLLYPAFCIQLPSVWQTIQETASLLVSEMLCVKPNGPYTLVSETWCGALAVEMGCQLEVQGHTVGLILIDSAPAVTQTWASMMGPPGSRVFDDTFISLLLKLRTFKINQEISQAASWPEKLKCALALEDKEKGENIGKGLTSFRSKLTAVLNYKPSGQLFQGQVHLLRQNTVSRYDDCELFQYCGENVSIHVIQDASTHAKLIASGDTASVINENTVHSW